ncbi:hypothetical protein Acr_16g0000840 [Actinidia rufa]|uniref:Uncharacterized protein n=1 Tax=Actinidia rufa TaxID=165716 RepID=A0A7J0FZ79_9ERIC|nr:hypothetical protein Acr_16g0000840 [Actinidia rufa]
MLLYVFLGHLTTWQIYDTICPVEYLAVRNWLLVPHWFDKSAAASTVLRYAAAAGLLLLLLLGLGLLSLLQLSSFSRFAAAADLLILLLLCLFSSQASRRTSIYLFKLNDSCPFCVPFCCCWAMFPGSICDYFGLQSTQSRLLAMWSSSCELTNVGECVSNRVNIGDSNSLPSWISDHLGESYIEDEVTKLLSSPREDPFSLKTSTLAIFPPDEREVNIMTPEDLEQIKESCSIPSSIQIRLLEMILHFYNIFPAQLVPNAWHSVVCAVVLWQYHKVTLSLTEFRNLFGLYKNPKPDFGWLYFKMRPKRTLFGQYPSNVKGWKRKFFFVSGDNWEFPKGLSREVGAPRISRSWGIPEGGNLYSVKVVLSSKTFRKSFGLLSKPMASREGDNDEDIPANRTTLIAGNKAMSKRISLKKLAQKVDELKSESSAIKPTLAKRVDIGEKGPRQSQKLVVAGGYARAIDELTKMKDDWDAIADKLAKSEILVAKLRQSVAHSKKLAVEEFKSSDDF